MLIKLRIESRLMLTDSRLKINDKCVLTRKKRYELLYKFLKHKKNITYKYKIKI